MDIDTVRGWPLRKYLEWAEFLAWKHEAAVRSAKAAMVPKDSSAGFTLVRNGNRMECF